MSLNEQPIELLPPFTVLDVPEELLDITYRGEFGYRGCGKAWAAILDGKVIGLKYMDRHTGCLTGASDEAKERAGVTKQCYSSDRAANVINRERFTAYREQARKDLQDLGEDVFVVGGMCSCCEFMYETRKNHEHV